jgi:phosphoglycerate dehydrogenase-like enzyme
MLKILLTGDGYTKKHLSDLQKKGFEITHRPEDLSQETLQSIISDFDAYILGGNERVTEEELKSAAKLKLIAFVGTGYTSFIEDKAAKKYNVAIRNTPAVMAPAVVEHTLGLIIGAQRKLFEQNWEVKNSSISSHKTQELSSICVGIVGMGEIGSRLSRILRNTFGSEVIYYSRTQKPLLESEIDIKLVSLEVLFSRADIIVLSLPTTQETEYFVNEQLLEKTKVGVILINTAGARLVEPKSLKKYIENKRIAATAFDGYYIEPLPSVANDIHGFLSMSDQNFIITPHTAAKTEQSWSRMLDKTIKNVVSFSFQT